MCIAYPSLHTAPTRPFCITPCAAVCSISCSQGNCTAPDTCTCESGWDGPTCSSPGGQQFACGAIVAGFQVGKIQVHVWGKPLQVEAVSCRKIHLHQATARCAIQCQHMCIALPSTHCTRTPFCTTPCAAVCSPSCDHGNCTAPGTCTCESGWEGAVCDSLGGQQSACEACACGWAGGVEPGACSRPNIAGSKTGLRCKLSTCAPPTCPCTSHTLSSVPAGLHPRGQCDLHRRG